MVMVLSTVDILYFTTISYNEHMFETHTSCSFSVLSTSSLGGERLGLAHTGLGRDKGAGGGDRRP